MHTSQQCTAQNNAHIYFHYEKYILIKEFLKVGGGGGGATDCLSVVLIGWCDFH
jgi:hypothetical protein